MKRRGLLLDRDGVINIDHGYVGTREQFEFMPNIFPFLRAVQDMGFRLAILTNQSGVARGMYTECDYRDLTNWMLAELARQGIVIDLVLACFEHPEGTVSAYARESFWRKPNPGMVLEAVQRLNLDPARSAFVGDNKRDMEAAERAGIKTGILFPHKVSAFSDVLKILQAAV
ncbi:MAG: D-glycero-alpha-D-manno-heptose-1,7-bisphosphate 7-phosphatase [Bdellovibrionales bacterium]